jgi:hypothetical protein
MPSFDPGRKWTVEDIEQAVKNPAVLNPLSRDWHGYGFFRSHEGYGVYATLGDEREVARATVIAFTTGEVWSADAYWLEACKHDGHAVLPVEEGAFRQALADYGRFLQGLGLKPPYKWIAGMENLKGRALYMPSPPGRIRSSQQPDGKCLVDVVTMEGNYSPGESVAKALKPFFAELYNACGVSRQSWQDAD